LKVKFRTSIHTLGYLNMHYIYVPAKHALRAGGIKQRLLCTVNSVLTFSCGMMPLKEGNMFIMLNKKRMKALGVENGDSIEVLLEPDHSKFGMEMPEELAEVLRQDREAGNRFRNLSPGKQRNIIYYVSQVKNTQKRIDRALLLLGNLKQLKKGKETVREIFMGLGN
jgi:hypothetical protein